MQLHFLRSFLSPAVFPIQCYACTYDPIIHHKHLYRRSLSLRFHRSIIFRALQGAGGSGIYALSTIMVPLMVPPDKFATYIAIVTSVFAFSSVLGPLLGGAITDNTTWRWVFFLK